MKFQIDSNQPVTIDIHRIHYHDRHDHNRHDHHDHIVMEPPLPPLPLPTHQPPEPVQHNHDEPNAHNCFMKIVELIGEAAHSVIKGFFHI